MERLPENTPIGRDYTVHRFIKEGLYNDCYVLKDKDGQHYFMKWYDMATIPEKMLEDGIVRECLICKDATHDNIISYVTHGSTDDGRFQYLITPFFKGKLLSEAIRTERKFSNEEIREIIYSILEALHHLHEMGFCHNDVNPHNILLEEPFSELSVGYVPKLIDLGHACKRGIMGAPPFPIQDLNVNYMAPEALNGIFGSRGDIYAVSVLLYSLLFGKLPYTIDLPEDASFSDKKKAIREARKMELTFPDDVPVDQCFIRALNAGLSPIERARPNAEQFKKILLNTEVEEETEENADPRLVPPKPLRVKGKEAEEGIKVLRNDSHQGGFADIAGMEQLKDQLTKRVIWILKDKEKADRYKLTPPNGMLLYGPPGCGKTFFAQKFAEETGFNYFLVNGSDLGSTYIHGTQGKIAELFEKAEKNAPSVICFDEFDSFVPSRGSDNARNRSEEVNEFLSQLNNCSARGIFVIGTTNRIDIIDPAILRKGRLDLHFEIPAPDLETRKKMFELHLKDRPCADIDLDHLAELTDNYAAADIAFIVNEAAMFAALEDADITTKHLEDSIRSCSSSLPPKEKERVKIGF